MKEFYVVKTKRYTTLCNEALREKSLSLKAKGLYAFMQSLPEDWDYTVKGLQAVLKEGYEAIAGALKELEASGYLYRIQAREKSGQYAKAVYILLEYREQGTVIGFPVNGQVEPKKLFSNEKSKRLKNKGVASEKKMSHHFEGERTYTKEELAALIVDINDVDF